MKPIIKYRGGKFSELSHITKYIPDFNGRYVEPFFGGGALFFHLEPKKSIINDINTKLMSFYIGVQNDYSNLRFELDDIEKTYVKNRKCFNEQKILHPNDKVEDKNEKIYYQMRDMFNDITNKDYSDALIYYYINKTAYSGMIRYNANGKFNVPFGRYPNLNTSLLTNEHSKLLQQTEIYNTDYKNIFDMLKPDDFCFLDPPYDCIFSDYGNEQYKNGFNNECHIKLSNDFKNLNCKTLMVIGKTKLTEELYHNMIINEYEKKYSVNIKNRFKSNSTHLIISNY